MYKILSTDSKEWNNYLSMIPINQQDIYFTREYYELYEKNDNGKGTLFIYEDKEKVAIYHFLIKEIDGYAPYAIRFSGGAYIHGVPVKYVKSESGDLSDPGMREFLSSIGTTPLSHRCVRNYTSHAKFLYDWIRIANAAVIVIE